MNATEKQTESPTYAAVAARNGSSGHKIAIDSGNERIIAGRPARIVPRVVIVGCGFGGLNAARTLAGKGADVTIIDRNNYHGFWPLLYQVATAGIEPESIAYPVRAIFREWRNVHFLMLTVRGVDFDNRRVQTNGGDVPYDYLVLAAGSSNNYFGNNSLAEHSIGLKDINEAERLRNRLLHAFEQAIGEEDPEKRRALLTFAIIGGGPTGVELAGAIAELIRHVLRKDYPMLDMTEARVVLVEATGYILAAFPEVLQASARDTLQNMGVEVRLESPVEAIGPGELTFKDGTTLKANVVVWAAGVRASMLADGLGEEQAKGGRVKVTRELHVPHRPEVFVIGDMAYLEGYKGGQAYPMVAQVAIQQGKRAARNILNSIAGRRMRPFFYLDEGIMATIGRRSAVLDAFGIRLSGRVAWFGWLLIHIMYLIGFRNRLIVLVNWAYNYFTHERGVRLITDEECED